MALSAVLFELSTSFSGGLVTDPIPTTGADSLWLVAHVGSFTGGGTIDFTVLPVQGNIGNAPAGLPVCLSLVSGQYDNTLLDGASLPFIPASLSIQALLRGGGSLSPAPAMTICLMGR